MMEMTTFNSEFNLMRNRNVFLTQTQSKIQSLEQEAETLNKGMLFPVGVHTGIFSALSSKVFEIRVNND